MNEILKRLFEMKDGKGIDFIAKLVPTVAKDRFIGIKTPELRQLQKELIKNSVNIELVESFLSELPHYYYEENCLHGFLISCEKKDIEKLLWQINRFLPYVDNWAVCDTMSPKLFKKYPERVYEEIKKWLKSENAYAVRFGIVSLLQFYLDDNFADEMLFLVASIKSDQYYINMAIAWYLSFALIKQYDTTIKLIEEKSLDKWIQNKSIQKAIESFRISDERKAYLRSLKM